MRWSEYLLVIIIALSLGLLGSIAVGANTPAIFWTLYLGIATAMAVMTFTAKKYRLLAIIIFDIVVFLIFTMQYPAVYQSDRDTGFEVEYTQEIMDAGRWDPGLGRGFAEAYYGYTPLLHFVMAFLSSATGLSVGIIAKYVLMTILRVVFLVLVYEIMGVFVKHKDVVFAAMLMFVISPRLRVVYISRRFMAAIMILLALYALLQARKQRKVWNVLFAVFSGLVIVADHTLSIVWLAVLFGMVAWYGLLSVLPKIFRKLDAHKALLYMLLRFAVYAIAWLMWNLYISPIKLQSDFAYIGELAGVVTSMTTSGQSYNSIQTLIIMGSQGIVGLAAFLGLMIAILKKPRYNQTDMLTYLAIVGFPCFGMLMLMMQGSMMVLSNITIWLPLIIISLMAGTFLFWLNRSRVGMVLSIVVVLAAFSGGILLQYHPDVLFAGSRDTIIELPEYKNAQILASGEWLAKQGPAAIIADRSIFDMYSSNFDFLVTPVDVTKEAFSADQTELEKRFLQRPVYFGNYPHTQRDVLASYIVINKDLLTHPSYHFDLTAQDLEKFEKTRLLRRVYENEKVIIYENTANEIR